MYWQILINDKEIALIHIRYRNLAQRIMDMWPAHNYKREMKTIFMSVTPEGGGEEDYG